MNEPTTKELADFLTELKVFCGTERCHEKLAQIATRLEELERDRVRLLEERGNLAVAGNAIADEFHQFVNAPFHGADPGKVYNAISTFKYLVKDTAMEARQ